MAAAPLARRLGRWAQRAGGRLAGLLRRDPWLAVLTSLATVQYAVLAPHLVYPDLGLDYPFHGGDSLDWLLNALAWTGEDVRNSFRSPALPLVLALLSRLGWLSFFPLLGLAFHHAAAVGAHLALRRRFGRATAFTCGLLVLTGASVLVLALQVMADLPAAILLGASCVAFLAAGRRPALYLGAGVLGGLSAVTQQAALLLPLPVAVTLLLVRRGDLRRPWLWAGAAAFAAPPGAWFVAKELLAGTFLDAGVRQWGLLGWQPENAPHYLVAAVSFWGWPALVLIAAGAVAALRDFSRRRGDAEDAAWALFPLLTTAVLLVFFAFFYDFLAKRFLVYAFVPCLALLARSLSGLRGTRAFGPAAVLAVAIAAWPLPNAELANRATLWPLPTVYSFLPTGHAFREPLPRFGDARLEVAGSSAAVRRSLWSRVLRASRKRPPAERDRPAAPDDVALALFLAQPGPRAPSRYVTLTRLGYAVRRRVSYVPQHLYPEDWWAWRGVEPLGVVDRYRLFHLRVPGVPRGAIVAFLRRDPRGRDLARRIRWGRDLAPAPESERLEETTALARDLAAQHGDRGLVLVTPEARGEWTRLLPFFTAGVLVLPDREEADRLAAVAERRGFGTTRVGLLRAVRGEGGRSTVTLVLAGPDRESR